MNRDTSNEDRETCPPNNPSYEVPPPIDPFHAGGSAHSREEYSPEYDATDVFTSEHKPMEDPSALASVEALLKRPARLVYEMTHGSATRIIGILAAITVICMLVYGFIMGTFSGGDQLWAVPVKVVAGMFLAAAICLPSLYIFSSLGGSRLSFRDVLGVLMLTLALTSVLLVGLAPVTWIFSQSTETAVFMGVMHLTFWGIGLSFGFRLLSRAFGLMNERGTSTLAIWGAIFIAVTLQMTSTLRPLVGRYEGPNLLGKKCFLTHWSDSLLGR